MFRPWRPSMWAPCKPCICARARAVNGIRKAHHRDDTIGHWQTQAAKFGPEAALSEETWGVAARHQAQHHANLKPEGIFSPCFGDLLNRRRRSQVETPLDSSIGAHLLNVPSVRILHHQPIFGAGWTSRHLLLRVLTGMYRDPKRSGIIEVESWRTELK
ncbi:hypothetical protein L209DRAFT_744208 [Thermothelomyces heterothallicus CBS 203.75]